MTTIDQPRQPSGTPTGGQWSGTEGADAGLDLSDGGPSRRERMLRDGSYIAPPLEALSSPEAYVEFWENVPVDDEYVMSVKAAYAAVRANPEAYIEPLIMREWERDNPEPTATGTREERRARDTWERARQEHAVATSERTARWLTKGAQSISDLDARVVARAHQMWWWATEMGKGGNASPAERYQMTQQVLAHPIQVTSGPTTVEQIEKRYRLAGAHGRTTKKHSTAVAEELLAATQNQNDLLARIDGVTSTHFEGALEAAASQVAYDEEVTKQERRAKRGETLRAVSRTMFPGR